VVTNIQEDTKTKNTFTESEAKEYVENGGRKCPKCNGEEIEGDSIEVNDNKVYQSIWCRICNAEWTDEYTLTGITEVE